ncbi:MAG: hypothetical protein O3A20_04095 [Planctomycetota bacterium]|nr:hypothetical protein [Planctomycetota bacterium]
MRIRVSLPELDLGALAGRLLPAGAELRALELDESGLRLEASAPVAGNFMVLADARFQGPTLTLSRFRVEGGMLARAFLGSKLSDKIARLDWRRGAVRAWGEPDGERLHLAWDGDSA